MGYFSLAVCCGPPRSKGGELTVGGVADLTVVAAVYGYSIVCRTLPQAENLVVFRLIFGGVLGSAEERRINCPGTTCPYRITCTWHGLIN
jgi:hypothetical protein